MPSTASEPTLPVRVEDITSPESFVDAITKLAACIHKAVNDGNSVTRPNKMLICLAAEEIRKSAKIYNNLRANFHDSGEPSLVADTTAIKDDIVSCVRVEVSRQLEAFSKRQEKRQSYAQAAATSNSTNLSTQKARPSLPLPKAAPTSRPALVVTPKVQPENREEAVRKFRECINFKVAKYAPARIQPLSNHKLRVEFDEVKHRDDALVKLNASSALSAEPARKLRPMLILKGISNDTPSEQLVDVIKSQNDHLKIEGDSDLELRFKRNNRNPKLYNAVFLVCPSVWHKALERGRLCVDYQQVHVEDFSPFLQCHRCLQFGHTKSKCSVQNSPCAYCAANDHIISDCPEKAKHAAPKCLNCFSHNGKFQTKLDVRHQATSAVCPRLEAMKERITSRIDYGSSH